MDLRLAVCFGVGVLALPASSLAQPDTGDAVRNWTAIAQCGSIADAGRRLGCMDDVLRRAGIATAAVEEPEPRQAPRQARAERPSPLPRQQQSEARGEVRELTTTIASVQNVGFQRYLVTTAEGSVWEQTEAETFNTAPGAGDAFSVEAAAMGSFRCRFKDSSRYRCRQVN